MSERIKVLPPQEARRIAAGEVVDRPAALVREFLDNAIDAGSTNIELSIEEGGCKKIEVCDDGSGMLREDLEICSLTHATSKIRCLDDLETAGTLGFRGEALAAAAAVARLEIISSADGREAWRLETGPGESPVNIEQYRRTKGTTVRALNIFESIPARKRFLKREGSEGTLCRQAFIDKVLSFNNINFRFVQDGRLKDFLPAVPSKKERFAAAVLKVNEAVFLHEINVRGNGFAAIIVIGSPDLYRTDRRQMFVFTNGRRVNEYSLIQALDYGAQGWFPNGTHPVGAVFVEIDPSLADFNIHPAKREVRFRDSGAIHQAVTGGLRNFFHKQFISASHKDFKVGGQMSSDKINFLSFNEQSNFTAQREKLRFDSSNSQNYQQQNHKEKPAKHDINKFLDTLRSKPENDKNSNNIDPLPPAPCSPHPVYVGRVFGLFILIEWNDKLYMIDQHAAHERILYDKFLKEPIPKQELLAPIPFTTETDDEDTFLESKREELSHLGIDIEKDEDGWRIDALPSDWRMGDAQTVKEILELRTANENIAERWAAALCCHAAIKDGDPLDNETAFALGNEALALPDPHCPHGRPVWTEISKEGLFKAVRRD